MEHQAGTPIENGHFIIRLVPIHEGALFWGCPPLLMPVYSGTSRVALLSVGY